MDDTLTKEMKPTMKTTADDRFSGRTPACLLVVGSVSTVQISSFQKSTMVEPQCFDLPRPKQALTWHRFDIHLPGGTVVT